MNGGVFEMSVVDYDKKFSVLPESLPTMEYKEQRKKNPDIVYGKASF